MTTTAQKVFSPESWKKNRSKYKVLKLLTMATPDTLATFEYLYANSGVPHNTLACNLKKWKAWKYITEGKDPVKTYRILNPGRLLIGRLAGQICPAAVAQWDLELQEWWSIRPPITDWTRPALRRQLEPLMSHRRATHPGASIYRKGGCYWVYTKSIYLLTAPYSSYVVKPVVKYKKLSNNWVFCRHINEIVCYVAARAPLLHSSVVEELVRQSMRGS